MTRLLLALAVIATLYAQTPGRTGDVSLLVVDELGHSLSGWKVTSFRSNDHDATSLFKGLSAKQVPLGFYTYTISGAGSASWTPTVGGRIEIFRPESFAVNVVTQDVLSGMSIDRALPQNFIIKGRLDPPPARLLNEQVWINIHRVLGPWSDINILVDVNGDFRIYRPPTGICTVTLIREGVVLHSEAVSFDQDFSSASLVLKISDRPPTLHRVTN